MKHINYNSEKSRQLTMEHVKKYKLDAEEQNILESFERGEWKSVLEFKILSFPEMRHPSPLSTAEPRTFF